MEKIKCAVCGEQFKQIQHRHLRQHGITFKEYKSKYPNAETCCKDTIILRSVSNAGKKRTEETKQKISTSNKKSWQENPFQGRTGSPLSEDSKKNLSKKLMNHYVSEETRIKISESGLGREPWNKGLTKDIDSRLQSISEKISIWNRDCFTPEMRAKIAQTLKQRYADGMPVPQSKGGFRKDLNMYFRSRWEANYARYLNYTNQKWEYEIGRFPFYDENNEILCVYVSDFFVNNEYVEIKGHAESDSEWSCNCKRCTRDKMKMTLFLQTYPQHRIRILGREEYKSMAEQFGKIIPNWEKTNRG